MKRQITYTLLAATFLTGTAAIGPAHAEPSVFPTGTTRYDPAKAYNEYVLFSGADNIVHLIDMNGNEVHRWNQRAFPPLMIDPALNGGKLGHVLVQTSQAEGGGTAALPGVPAIFGDKTIGELDWDGKLVWEWGSQVPGGAARQHHDIRRLANGDTLVLANLIHTLPGFKAAHILDDVIYQVGQDGKTKWQWLISDHLAELGFTPAGLKLVRDSGVVDCFHINNMTPLGPNKWFDKGDARFAPDNILIDSRDANFIIIIDRKTGRVVWNLGPTYSGGAGHAIAGHDHHVPRPVDQISGQHDAHFIEQGLPGAGNLLVFDNQGPAGYPPVSLPVDGGSRILEIDPTTKQIVWEYSAGATHAANWTFDSPFISSARRLPNGNTLIDEGINGRFFQVTATGEIVWEYVSTFYGPYPASPDTQSNWVYRATPVPYSWVPVGTPHSEKAVTPLANTAFHIAPAP